MRSRSRRLAVLLGIAVLVLAALAASASASVRFKRIPGYHSPGTPAKYNKVGILMIGPKHARNVLVLNPGTSASAAYFAPLAKTVTHLVHGWQVWAVERRENLLEDHSMLNKAKFGKATGRQLFDYYLGWLSDPSIKKHFQLIPDSKVGYARQWGMNVEIQDLNRVVKRAKALGGKVVVGGHSLGGSITTAYATWDFHGKPGAKGLAGLVFIDGGSGPAPMTFGMNSVPLTADEAHRQLQNLANGSPWLSFGGIGAPYAGLFNASGSVGAIIDPNSPSLGQQFPLLPANLKPPVPVTNLGQYGYALDTETSPPGLIAAQAHLGHLAPSGNPRGWVRAGELTPIRRYAEMFSGWGLRSLDGTAWYHPMRLTIDSGAVAAGNPNPAQAVLNVHATHGHDLPHGVRMYAFGAALGDGRVLDATRILASQSGIPKSHLKLVDRHTTYAHNDPNSAYPKNAFIKNLVPFLKRLARH